MSDYGHELDFGTFITPAAAAADGVVRGAELAEEIGLDIVSYQDHPYQSRYLDAWTLLAFVAARTNRVKVLPNVLNLPLRPPAVVARAAASLDLLSGGRVELGLGAGLFWDAIEAMGGERRTAGESVEALAEAISVIRAIWDVESSGGARFDGEHYRLGGAARGPAPAHPIGLWIGSYKPRMLRLTGRLGDGWLPGVPYLQPADVARGNEAIDAAAIAAGRDPREIRRLMNISATYADGSPGPTSGSVRDQVEELTRLALEDGISGFILLSDDPDEIRGFAADIAPAVRELVEAERAAPSTAAAEEVPRIDADGKGSAAPTAGGPGGEYDRLGVTPTPDDGVRHGELPWDESTRPHRSESSGEVEYTGRGKAAGQHLIDVHDHLRQELVELREIVTQVRDGALGAGDARSALNEMALRQNDWTLGAFCSRYCHAVAQHHGLEDAAIFPHLQSAEPELVPVIDRLGEEHLVIHDAIEEVDRALVHHLEHPGDFDRVQSAIDGLTDTLLSHLSYEERELVEPLARFGMFPGGAL
jgi:Luciferase-like monooxygenase/Hemerythrin HHE cation binding domain